MNSLGDPLDEVNNIEDVAKYFKTSKSTIERAIKAGKLKFYKQGQIRKFRREWVLEYEQSMIEDSAYS